MRGSALSGSFGTSSPSADACNSTGSETASSPVFIAMSGAGGVMANRERAPHGITPCWKYSTPAMVGCGGIEPRRTTGPPTIPSPRATRMIESGSGLTINDMFADRGGQRGAGRHSLVLPPAHGSGTDAHRSGPGWCCSTPVASPPWSGAAGTVRGGTGSRRSCRQRAPRSPAYQAPKSDEQTIRPDAKMLLVAGAGWTKKQADGAVHAAEAEQLDPGIPAAGAGLARRQQDRWWTRAAKAKPYCAS